MAELNGLPQFLTLTERVPKVSEMAEVALLWATIRNPDLGQFPKIELKQYIQEILNNIERFHEVAKREQAILVDTDIVFVLSGAGTYNEITSDDVYKPYLWALATDFQRLDRAVEIVKKITSDRTNIPLDQVSRDDVNKSGPVLVYNGRPPNIQSLKEAIMAGRFDLPLNKVQIIETVQDTEGNIRSYINTIDQMRGFRQSQFFDSHARRIILLSHDAHIVRALHIMGKHCLLQDITTLQAYPIPTPSWGIIEHTVLEVSGILYYSLISGDATRQPHPHEILG